MQLATKHAGAKEGTLSFRTYDADERAFDFKLSGIVTPAPSLSALTEDSFDVFDPFHRHDFDLI